MFITRIINEKLDTALAAAVFVSGVCLMAGAPAAAACTLEPSGTAQVAAVDLRLELRLTDGRKLKLAGVEPPRATLHTPTLPQMASAWLNEEINGSEVFLFLASPERDRWGRHIAVLTAQHTANLALDLIRAGWGRFDPADATAPCASLLLAAEDEARSGGRGVWADPEYRVRNADRPEDFAGLSGSMVLAEGVVAQVARWRTLTFLNFGKARRGEVSATLSRALALALEKAGQPPSSLKGARVRVRGMMNLRNSPRIELYSAAAIEILAAAPLSASPDKEK